MLRSDAFGCCFWDVEQPSLRLASSGSATPSSSHQSTIAWLRCVQTVVQAWRLTLTWEARSTSSWGQRVSASWAVSGSTYRLPCLCRAVCSRNNCLQLPEDTAGPCRELLWRCIDARRRCRRGQGSSSLHRLSTILSLHYYSLRIMLPLEPTCTLVSCPRVLPLVCYLDHRA